MILIILVLFFGGMIAIIAGKEVLYKHEEQEKLQQLKEILNVQNTITKDDITNNSKL